MKDPSKAIRSVKPTLGRKKTEEFLRKLKGKKKKMGGGMLRYNKGGGADMSKVKQKKQGPAGGLRKIKKENQRLTLCLIKKVFN